MHPGLKKITLTAEAVINVEAAEVDLLAQVSEKMEEIQIRAADWSQVTGHCCLAPCKSVTN